MILEVKDLTVRYGEDTVLHGVRFSVSQGEIVSVVGPNGAGKSTAMHAVCGLLREFGGRIERGSITYQESDIRGLRPHQLVQLGVALVPQDRHLFPTMTVAENLEMGAYSRRHVLSSREDMKEVLALFPELAERRNQIAGTLSGGEQQMLAIGRALLARPSLLLLDEPSASLSPDYVDLVFQKIEQINGRGATILLNLLKD